MSLAAMSPGDLMAYTASENFTHKYTGIFEGGDCTFYFNTNDLVFLCLAKFGGEDVKMAGNLTFQNLSSVECSPAFGVRPGGNNGWEDTSGEEVKNFDLTGQTINFESSTLTRAN